MPKESKTPSRCTGSFVIIVMALINIKEILIASVTITGANINCTRFHNLNVSHNIFSNHHNISQNTHININTGDAAIKTHKIHILATKTIANHTNGATNTTKNTNLNNKEINVST